MSRKADVNVFALFAIDQFHKSQNAPVPYPTVHHSEQKCAHFCSVWSIVGYGKGAFWDLWIRSITVLHAQLWWSFLCQVNSLWPSDIIWYHGTWSALLQIMTNLWSLVAALVVIMTTYSAISDGKVIKLMIFCSGWPYWLSDTAMAYLFHCWPLHSVGTYARFEDNFSTGPHYGPQAIVYWYFFENAWFSFFIRYNLLSMKIFTGHRASKIFWKYHNFASFFMKIENMFNFKHWITHTQKKNVRICWKIWVNSFLFSNFWNINSLLLEDMVI